AKVILADLENLSQLKGSLTDLYSESNGNKKNSNSQIHYTSQNVEHQETINQVLQPDVFTPLEKQSLVNAQTLRQQTINVETILVDLVVQQTGYPSSSITLDLKLLDDLSLDSIKAGQLIAEVSKKCGVVGEIDDSSLANASLKDITEVIKSVISKGNNVSPTMTHSNSLASEPKIQNHIMDKLNQLSEAEIDSLLSVHFIEQ
ncbi:MAG: phosphopantetheine-binding protein, partial [Dolichospermum sp.]